MKIKALVLFVCFGCLALSSCSIKRSLPEGASLYKGSKLKIVKANKKIESKALEANFESLLKSPKPNKKFLGIRWKLRWHNLLHTKKKKGLLHWLQKKLGEPPVLYDEQVTNKIEKVLENRALNNGFFKVAVETTVRQKKRKVKVKYTVKIREASTISAITNAIADSSIKAQVELVRAKSLIKTGATYNLNLLKKERERIMLELRLKGYYFFRDSDLKFRADTTSNRGKVHLELVLKDFVDTLHLKPQKINKVFVFPDMNVIANNLLPKDTLNYEGLQIIYKKELLQPSTLRDVILFKKGQLYNPEVQQNTIRRLFYLRNYQFIDVQFVSAPSSDSLLNVVIRLTPRKRNVIEGSIGLSFSPELYIGPELSVSYLNRNLFKGAEQLRLSSSWNPNFTLDNNIGSFQEMETKAELSKPALIIPFSKKRRSDQLVATTKVSLTFSRVQATIPLKGTDLLLQDGGFFTLLDRLQADSNYAPSAAVNDLDFELSYQWRKRRYVSHELIPIQLVLQNPQFEVPELGAFISSQVSRSDLGRLLLLKPSYSFSYDSRLKALRTHNYFYRNKATLISSRRLSAIFPSLSPTESIYTQIENDFRYFWRASKRHTIGFRLAAKVSVPLNGQINIPFSDLYTIGGPNSIRAFSPREVGPGNVELDNDLFFFKGSGDVLIESSLEWRPKITKVVELGFFLDAGNVWFFQEGTTVDSIAVFHIRQFFKQLAVGTGWGLRFDFNSILLRLDFAFPLHNPGLPVGERWVADKISISNMRPNLGLGYSF